VTREALAVMAAMTVVPTILIGLVILSALAVGRLQLRGGHAAYAVTGAALITVMVAGLVGAFWFWGVGFDYADALRQPPAYVDRAMLLSFWIAVAAYAGIITTGLLAVRAHRRLTTAD
jgi:hypothetical protein